MHDQCLDHEEIDERPEWPTGDNRVVITDECIPLFISVTYHVTATLNGKQVAQTDGSQNPHGEGYVRTWARQLLRGRESWFRSVGVDVSQEYARFGGDPSDLDGMP